MPFDLQSARKEGTDTEIAEYLASKANFNLEAARKEGTDTEIVEYLAGKVSAGTPTPPPVVADDPGIMSKLGNRAEGVVKAFTEPIASVRGGWGEPQPAGFFEAGPQRLLRAGGQVMAGVGDIAGEAAKGLYKTVTPEPVQKGLAMAGKSILDTEAGQLGLKALQAGGEAYGKFKAAYPDLAKDVEAATNIAMNAPMVKAVKGMAGDIARTGVKILPASVEEKLYGSATKMPLSKKWVKTAGPTDISIRQKAIREGIKSEILPTESGLKQVAALEEQARKSVDDIVEGLAKGGKTIKRADLLAGLDDAYKTAEVSSLPEVAEGALGKLKATIEKFPSDIPVDIVQRLKRQFYKESSWTGVTPTGVGSQFTAKGRKGIASAAMRKLEELDPSLKSLNQTDAARIALKEGIERAVGRIGNRNLSDLGSEIMAGAGAVVGGGPGAAVGFTLKKLIEMPELKSKMAFAINRAKKAGYKSDIKQIGKAAGLSVGAKSAESLPDLVKGFTWTEEKGLQPE